MNNLEKHSLLPLTELGINIDSVKAINPFWKRAHYRSVINWLTKYTSDADATNLKKVQSLTEAFYHFSNVEDWERASYILFSRLESFNNEPLHNQLHSWGYHSRRIEMLTKLSGKLNSQVDALCLRNLGNSYMILGEHEQAIKLYQQSLALAQKDAGRQNEWSTIRNLCNFYFSKGEYYQTIGSCHLWLSLPQEVGDPQGKGEALALLAASHYFLGEHQKATEFFHQCLIYAQTLSEPRKTSNVLTTLGNVYSLIQEYEKAIECYQQSLKIAQATGNQQIGGVWRNLGNALIKLEKHSEALEAFWTALEKSRSNGVRVGEAVSLFDLSSLHQKLGNHDSALEYCDLALSLATELGIPLAKECEELKSQLLDVVSDL